MTASCSKNCTATWKACMYMLDDESEKICQNCNTCELQKGSTWANTKAYGNVTYKMVVNTDSERYKKPTLKEQYQYMQQQQQLQQMHYIQPQMQQMQAQENSNNFLSIQYPMVNNQQTPQKSKYSTEDINFFTNAPVSDIAQRYPHLKRSTIHSYRHKFRQIMKNQHLLSASV